MADEPVTAVAVEEHHEAAAIDALAQAASTAQVAAAGAVASAAIVAEHGEAVAAEHAEQLETKVVEHVAAQEDQLSWLKEHARTTAERLESQSSALTQIADRQSQTDLVLQKLTELLTPKASPEPAAANPEEIAAQNEAGEGPKAAEPKPEPGRRKHRSI